LTKKDDRPRMQCRRSADPCGEMGVSKCDQRGTAMSRTKTGVRPGVCAIVTPPHRTVRPPTGVLRLRCGLPAAGAGWRHRRTAWRTPVRARLRARPDAPWR